MTKETSAAERFRRAYEGQPPWDVGHAQQAFVDIADQVRGSILDAGCGTGDNALFFAQRSHRVVGIDFLEEPIRRAKAKAAARQREVTFLVMDALQLSELAVQFDNVIDCGLFHVFRDEHRLKYVASLHGVLRPGGTLRLLCFSDKEPGDHGPRRVSQQEIRQAFHDGWTVESIVETHFDTSPHAPDVHTFSDGGPIAHLATIRRNA